MKPKRAKIKLPPSRIYLSRGKSTGSWEWNACWSDKPLGEGTVQYALIETICGGCGVHYFFVEDEEKHGFGKCVPPTKELRDE